MLRQGNAAAAANFVRHFSRKVQPNPRRINPKVPLQEAHSIANSLYHIIKQHGPITVSNTWNFVKDASIGGLHSKTHMKTLLKWMRGRKMLKLFCTHVGSSKSFFHTTLPEDPLSAQNKNPITIFPAAAKPSAFEKRRNPKHPSASKAFKPSPLSSLHITANSFGAAELGIAKSAISSISGNLSLRFHFPAATYNSNFWRQKLVPNFFSSCRQKLVWCRFQPLPHLQHRFNL